MKNQDNKISLKDLAKLEGGLEWQSKYNTIRSRVQRNKYATYQIINGEGYVDINDSAITDTIRIKLFRYGGQVQSNSTGLIPAPAVLKESKNELNEKQLEIALARADLLKLYSEFVANKGGSKLEAKHKFVETFNSGAIPNLYKITGAVTFKTIERWKKDYYSAKKDYRVLAPKYQTEKSQAIPAHQVEVLIKLVLNPNKPLVSEVIRMAKDIFTMKHDSIILSDTTYRRFLLKWQKDNYADWIFFREGEKALDDKVLPYLERDYNKIEVGDIIVADGHTLNFEIINPYTGKPKRMTMVLFFDMKSSMPLGCEIAPSENSMAIAVALRRSILVLGKYPKVIYIDNGRAFCSKLLNGEDWRSSGLTGIFERIGAQVINAIPYHAQSKTIERFFKTFAEIERFIPSYSGTSIEMQPPRLNRGEKLHNKLYNKMMNNSALNLYSAYNAIAWWFDKYASRVQKDGHLKGLTPREIFEAGKGPGVDKEELNFLMMSMDVKTIYRNGVKMFGTSYYHEALYGRQLDNVVIRYDLIETDSIFIYERSGSFICEALRVDKVHPAAGILGTSEDVQLLQDQLSRKAELKKSTTGSAKQFLQDEVYPALDRQLKEADIIRLDGEEKTSEKSNTTDKKKKRNLLDSWSEPENNYSKNIHTIPKVAEG